MRKNVNIYIDLECVHSIKCGISDLIHIHQKYLLRRKQFRIPKKTDFYQLYKDILLDCLFHILKELLIVS